MNTRPAIQLSDVDKVYANGTVALRGVNLTIGRSQFVSLVGPSGCGKSTILRLIAGLGQKSAGDIQRWQPEDVTEPSLHELAFVFQEAALMPWASVADNIRLPLELARVPRRAANTAVREAIGLVGLSGFERAYPRELSGGMKMRVSIARALVTRPTTLLMDEPFGALDEMTRSRLNSDLLELWQQKRWTIVFVTHNVYEAVYLSNRVVVMAAHPGRITADIPIEAAYPRTEEFRTSLQFNQYCRQVSASLAGVWEDPLPSGTTRHSRDVAQS
ncbi:ABC transporter ATP-binding protein [Leptolyngbya sp. FACHB-261]|uniref:ABC transporter ATP-binding protein n=1 Tax=Leptolyngbya sp. FACHB-261 TaxID=2692806 RepID=UPI0016824F24|nr:ABC transporter ATP-binding protein [Leptolyngbya sp. FACHB-261]MBD2103743.1 ABC transporter ATP-binding protein [Leptolyngbya sp. FACHB-261]